MILKKPLFPFLFVLILVIGILQTIATQFYFYWLFSWFDILMHFLGGFWFGFAAIWLFYLSGYFISFTEISSVSLKKICTISLISALGVGILWEVFEYFTGLTFTVDKYVFDTILDLIMDTIGGFTAAFFIFKYLTKQDEQKS